MVSVITATYNWPEALRFAIQSVLAQTIKDWELLVVGDACDDDSAGVVASFGDPRIAWFNLDRRSGSQSRPNNFALRRARGTLIAYLGHDDIWHPEHLRRLVDTIERDGADIACSITAMYGPPGSGIRGMSGVFVDDRFTERDFLPPSSILHRTGLGEWPMPDECDLPVDCEFLQRAFRAGRRVVSTGRLTTFKFNSAWRRNSYLAREANEQESMWMRLCENAAATEAEELAGMLRAAREKRLIESEMPSPANYSRIYERYRGLATPDRELLTAPRRITPEAGFQGLEWHAPEAHPEFGAVRWSGPAPSASVWLPTTSRGPVLLAIALLNFFDVDLAAELTVELDGAAASFTQRQDGGFAVSLLVEANQAPSFVTITSKKMRCPYFLFPGERADTRWMGFCLRYVEVAPR